MPRVLFVCTGNICRSPFTERYAAHRAAKSPGWEFASAGTYAMQGYEMCPIMDIELQKTGANSRRFRAQQCTEQLMRQADIILALENQHRRFLLEEMPAAVRKTFTLGAFARRIGEVPAGASWQEILSHFGVERRRSRSEDNVPDPYNKGSEAAAVSAGMIIDMLDVIIPRLTN